MTADAIVYLEDVTVTYDGFKALQHLNFFMERRALRVVIGPNGAGKTTLFNLIAGALAPSAGEIRFRDEPISGLSPDRIFRQGVPDPAQHRARRHPEARLLDGSVEAGAR